MTTRGLIGSQPQGQLKEQESSLTIRQLLVGGTVGGLAALTGAGVIGYAWRGSSSPAKTHTRSSGAPGVSPSAAAAGTYMDPSRPDQQPPVLSATVSGTLVGIPEYILLANKPYKKPTRAGQRSPLIATLERTYTTPARLRADNQITIQLLPGNWAFVGWGTDPYFSEFGSAGSLLLKAALPNSDQSYWAFTADWIGHPADKPALRAFRSRRSPDHAAKVRRHSATTIFPA